MTEVAMDVSDFTVLPVSGSLTFGSSKRRPVHPGIVTLDGHQVKRYRLVGEQQIGRQMYAVWRRRNLGSVLTAGLPMYVFQSQS